MYKLKLTAPHLIKMIYILLQRVSTSARCFKRKINWNKDRGWSEHNKNNGWLLWMFIYLEIGCALVCIHQIFYTKTCRVSINITQIFSSPWINNRVTAIFTNTHPKLHKGCVYILTRRCCWYFPEWIITTSF